MQVQAAPLCEEAFIRWESVCLSYYKKATSLIMKIKHVMDFLVICENHGCNMHAYTEIYT